MSARQDVFKYLEGNPDAPLNEVLSAHSSYKESTVRRYFFEYQKSDNKPAKRKSTKKSSQAKSSKTAASKKRSTTKAKAKASTKEKKRSLKQQVADHLDNSPDISLDELCKAFPKSQKSTLGNYRRQWQKENAEPAAEVSEEKKKAIFTFLDKRPNSNINDLRKIFPETGNKLITIFRSWKNKQNNIAGNGGDDQVNEDKSEKVKGKPVQGWLDKHKETIARQKKIIENQKTRIEVLKSQIPRVRRPGIIDSLREFLVKKLTKK